MASPLPYYVNSSTRSESGKSFDSDPSLSFGLSNKDRNEATRKSGDTDTSAKSAKARKSSERPNMPSMQDLLKDALQKRPEQALAAKDRQGDKSTPPKLTRRNRRNSWSSGMSIRDVAAHEKAKILEHAKSLEQAKTKTNDPGNESSDGIDDHMFGMFQWASKESERSLRLAKGSSPSLAIRDGSVRTRSTSMEESIELIGSTVKRLHADIEYNKTSGEKGSTPEHEESDHKEGHTSSRPSSVEGRRSTVDDTSDGHEGHGIDRHSQKNRDDKEKGRDRKSRRRHSSEHPKSTCERNVIPGESDPCSSRERKSKRRKDKKRSKKDKMKTESKSDHSKKSSKSSKREKRPSDDKNPMKPVPLEESRLGRRGVPPSNSTHSSEPRSVDAPGDEGELSMPTEAPVETAIANRSVHQAEDQPSIDLPVDDRGGGKLNRFFTLELPCLDESPPIEKPKLKANDLLGIVTQTTAASTNHTSDNDETGWRPTFPKLSSHSTMGDSTVGESSIILQFEPEKDGHVDRVRPDRSNRCWVTFEDQEGSRKGGHITEMPRPSRPRLLEKSKSTTGAFVASSGARSVRKLSVQSKIQRGTSFRTAIRGVFQRQKSTRPGFLQTGSDSEDDMASMIPKPATRWRDRAFLVDSPISEVPSRENPHGRLSSSGHKKRSSSRYLDSRRTSL